MKPPSPNEKHELLKPFEGTFRATVSIFMGGPEPMVTTGIMVSEFVVDGLYLQQVYTGDPVEGPFPSFNGRGFWGYNFVTSKYEGFWIDNASSIMQREDGTVDDTGKIWEMLSEINHPQQGTTQKRTVIRLIDNDHHEAECFMTLPNGENFKSMELKYVRQA